ncbi:NADP-reducing hydrogenase subunit HndC [Planctomycetes bacterium Pan216]|uniref:NADP-reducing hydrogenase subunit HndC n=1 Tax=Kolteria novifilia TaxID=2527975 RepID=A0A518AYC4_9BACT|nr:NADP-reducing hydrogenase subunit HndC [Planctomycetes bacterium Pan216]
MTHKSIPTPDSFTLRIDGTDVVAQVGQSILEVAQDHNIGIPTLCYLEGLTPWGGCRLCLVEIKGSGRLLPACSTLATEDMDVTTTSPRIERYRRTIVELLFSERNHICAVCVSNGNCELQTLAQEMGVTHVHVPYRYPTLLVDSSHDGFRLDHNRCVMCTRCVRVCEEIEGAATKGVGGRGIDSMIINDLNEPWGESDTCTSCGKCVSVCPTGALTEKGTTFADMAKRRERRELLPYLTQTREGRR